MFCPKCGTKNPDNGQFCRKCGTDLAVVSDALSGTNLGKNAHAKKKKSGWESAIGSLSMGVAFLTVSFILALSGNGRGWWFWILIPGFTMLGAGISKIITINQDEKEKRAIELTDKQKELESKQHAKLPPKQTDFVSNIPDEKYETGDLVPPSVVENTTRHLELDQEGKTMTLPKD